MITIKMPPKKKKSVSAGAGRKRAGPKRKRAPARRRAAPPMMEGGAWYNDLWDGIKSVGSTIARNVKPSQVLGFIPDPRAQAASVAARTVGLGHRGGAIMAPPGTGFRTQPVPIGYVR